MNRNNTNTMKCLECQSNDFSLDTRLGELVCNECGLVLVTEPFEQTSYAYDANGERIREAWNNIRVTKDNALSRRLRTWAKGDRAIYTGITMCKVLLSTLNSAKSLSDRVDQLYRALYRKHVFTTTILEDRAAAVVYYILKEANLPFTLKEVCKEYDCVERRVFKLAKKIANELNNTSVFLMRDSSPFAEKYAVGLGNQTYVSKVGRVANHYDNLVKLTEDNLRPSSPVAFCWIVSLLENMGITQKIISEHTGFTTRAIYDETKRLLKIKNTNKEEIEGRGIEWIETY